LQAGIITTGYITVYQGAYVHQHLIDKKSLPVLYLQAEDYA
jgi:hypothetical protein